jgi:hypothetical protein
MTRAPWPRSDCAVAADHGDFAGDHDVEGAVESVDQRVTATVKVVEFGLGHGVVDVERGNEKLAEFLQLVETMDAGGRFFGDAFPFFHQFVEDVGALGVDFFEEIFDHFLLMAAARAVDPIIAFLEFVTFVEEEGDVAAVVDDELRALAFGIDDGFPRAVPIFLECFTFPGEDGDAGGGDGRGGLVLRGENVAAGPTDVGPEFNHRLDEHGGLDRHVERSGDADVFEGFVLRVFLANGHQAGHFFLGDFDFLATPVGKGDVGNFEVVGDFGRFGCSGAHGV